MSGLLGSDAEVGNIHAGYDADDEKNRQALCLVSFYELQK